VIAFDDKAEVRMSPTDLAKIDEFTEDFNPMRNHGGGTDIARAIEEAERVASDFFAQAPAGGVPTDAVILVMSDGGHNSGPDVKALADRIKATHGGRVTICAALFATVGASDPAGELLLKSIVTDPVRGYSTVYTPEALRDFFTASLVRASGVQLR
jgi:Mg-chelatase subunit ChlD